MITTTSNIVDSLSLIIVDVNERTTVWLRISKKHCIYSRKVYWRSMSLCVSHTVTMESVKVTFKMIKQTNENPIDTRHQMTFTVRISIVFSLAILFARFSLYTLFWHTMSIEELQQAMRQTLCCYSMNSNLSPFDSIAMMIDSRRRIKHDVFINDELWTRFRLEHFVSSTQSQTWRKFHDNRLLHK
jgi:hypothetical protein